MDNRQGNNTKNRPHGRPTLLGKDRIVIMRHARFTRMLLPLSYTLFAATLLSWLSYPVIRALLGGRNPIILAGAPMFFLIAGCACQAITLVLHGDRRLTWLVAFVYLLLIGFIVLTWLVHYSP